MNDMLQEVIRFNPDFSPDTGGAGGGSVEKTEQQKREEQFAELMGSKIVTLRNVILRYEENPNNRAKPEDIKRAYDSKGYPDILSDALKESGLVEGSLEYVQLKKRLNLWSRYSENEVIPENEDEYFTDLMGGPESPVMKAREEMGGKIEAGLNPNNKERFEALGDEYVTAYNEAIKKAGINRDTPEGRELAGRLAAWCLMEEPKREEPNKETTNVERREMPTEPEKYRKFIRKMLVEVIQNETETGKLNFNQIETSIKTLVRERLMGSSPSEGNYGYLELYPEALGDHREELRELIKEEVEARANLRKLQINEERYKQGNKKNSLTNYLRDMEGSEGSFANPSNISIETYRWLKNLDSLGDPDLTTGKVDKALMVLLKLGEQNPDFSDPEMSSFTQFRTGSKNIYDPSYGEDSKKRALDEVASRYGNDAFNIAYQIFQAYKEEGNYNPDHYLYGLFQFAQARKGSYAGGTPTGSIRVYSEQSSDGGHETQIPFLALSPLRAQQKISETMDPVSGEPKDVKEPFFLYKKALQGLFLRSFTPSTIKNTPEREAYATVKEAVTVKTAIENIGILGTLANKGDQIPEAVKHLITLRKSGQELVDKKVFTQEEWDKQMLIETKNAIWELSINYPTNKDLRNQSLAKPYFLLPSKLIELFVKLGDLTGNRELRIIQNESDYSVLREYVTKMMKTTYDRIKDQGVKGGKIPWHKEDDEILKNEKKKVYNAELPRTLGNSESYPSGIWAMLRGIWDMFR